MSIYIRYPSPNNFRVRGEKNHAIPNKTNPNNVRILGKIGMISR